MMRRLANYELSSGAREALRKASAINEQARETLLETQRAFAANVAPALEMWRLQLPKVQDWFVEYGPMLAARQAAQRRLAMNADAVAVGKHA